MTGHDLQTRRKALGLTQEVFAEKIGMSISTVARWEQAADTIIGISKLLEYTFVALINEKRESLQKELSRLARDGVHRQLVQTLDQMRRDAAVLNAMPYDHVVAKGSSNGLSDEIANRL